MSGATELRRLVGVYDADGTPLGELRYWIGARLGRAHCALCDLTHGTFRERSDWRRCAERLPVEFETYHRDDQPDEVRSIAEGRAPVVVAETAVGWALLLGPEELEALAGDLAAFEQALEAAMGRAGIGP